MKAVNIKWEVDELENLDYLPTEVEIPDHLITDDENLLDNISDWLSDEFGFCHDGFEIGDTAISLALDGGLR